MDYAEAEAYGLELTDDQQELLRRNYGYALVGQIMPVTNCCDRGRQALGACDRNHDRKRIIVPTVIEIADEVTQAEEERKRQEHLDKAIKGGWISPDAVDELPMVYGYALDMVETALDWGCGCALTGEINCGCDGTEDRGQFFSPYAVVPVDEQVAIAILQAASRELPAGAYYPLYELTTLQNHGLESVYDDAVDEMPDFLTPEYDAMVDKYMEPLIDIIAGEAPHADPRQGLHVDRRMFSFEIPEDHHEPVLEMQENQKKLLRQYTSLFKRSPRTLRVEADKIFAYPCDD